MTRVTGGTAHRATAGFNRATRGATRRRRRRAAVPPVDN